ncbi:hypothetical protein NYF23_09220 [SAR92 clade bacterium H455]|uniref:Prenyltransferase n=1 Tax=SAR92 clade bacterium H455 TaxID=2974818 RepID=A0ABY5TNN2_9GAMM|nr:hypothetical protein NYF23_09220 [SAR92 clade bacterium H455]
MATIESNIMIKLTNDAFIKARNYLLAEGRILEKRLFDYYFESGSSSGVFHSILAYQNDDGGFGWGLEPDTASPESQPLFTVMALLWLDRAQRLDVETIKQSLGFLLPLTFDDGGLPWMLKPNREYPRANHFDKPMHRSVITITAPIVGLCEKYGIHNEWTNKASKFVWESIKEQQDEHVQCAQCMHQRLFFLENTSNSLLAERAITSLRSWISSKNFTCFNVSHPEAGLYLHPTPTCYANHPDSALRPAFSDEQINASLDALISRQDETGAWATGYGYPNYLNPGMHWDGMYTINALKTLKDYDRIEVL